jgi:hypothetical protein
MIDDATLPVPLDQKSGWVSTLDQLAAIPEEEIWLQKQKSARTRRAYRQDVQHFVRTLAINPQTAARLRAYLDDAGHAGDSEGPMFRPLRHNGKQDVERRHMDPDAIDRVVRKYAGALGLDRGYSAHSMRATFITTALENGAQLEDVQKAAGHRDPSTTKLYDRRGYNPEKAASFFATYLLINNAGGSRASGWATAARNPRNINSRGMENDERSLSPDIIALLPCCGRRPQPCPWRRCGAEGRGELRRFQAQSQWKLVCQGRDLELRAGWQAAANEFLRSYYYN